MITQSSTQGKFSMHNWIMCAVLCLVQTMLFGNGSPSKMGAPTMMPCPTDISLSSFTELDGRFQFCEGDTGRYEVNWFIGTDPAVIASFTYLWYRDVNANGVYDIITDALITSDEGNDGVLNDLIYTTAMQDGEQIGVVISMAGCMNTRDLNTYVPIRKKACTVESLGCVCVNNATDTTDGTFRDTIRIEGFPNQQWNWELIASEGMLDNNTGLDFFAPVTIFPAVAGDSVILFVIQHRDDIGYSGIFSTGDTEYSVGNGCSYPNPEINLINIYCQDHPAIQMIVTEESGQGSAGVITVNGVQLLGDIYDPSTRDPGTVDTVRYSWIDPAGCIQPASLLVQIDQTPLESIACYDQINVSIGINGIAVITGDMMVPNRACAAAYDVDIMGLPTNVVTCSEIGQIFMVRVTNPGDGSSCMGSILVEDKFGPELTQLIDTLPCTIDPYEVADSILVFAFDNSCTPFVSLTGQRVFYATYCAGQDSLVVTWTATDSYGNKTVKTFVYHWFKPSLAEIDFPANVTQECGSSIDTSITGIPTYEGLPLGYFCTYNVTFTDGVKIKNGCPGKYYIRRTWEVEDWCTWQSRTVVQYLYFEDTQAPIVVCPANLTLASDANYCGLNYILPNIAVAADCSGIKFKKFDILPYASFLNPGQSVQLPPGVHTVVVTVSDSCGNLSSCFYSLTIKDLTSPTVVCQDVNISLNNLGEAILFPNMMLAEAYDNCALAPANTTKIKKMGETDIQFRDSIHLNCSNVGNFLAIIRVFDVAGNFTDCMDTITVIDTIVPTVICSTSFVINLDLNGLDTIQASEITEIIGSSCAGVLSFSFTNPLATPQRIFTCDSLAAEPFDVFVYQNGVLIATCLQVDPIVIDNPSAPCSSMKINVQGKVQTSTGIPLYQVNLQVVGQANKHTTTSQSGLYYLNGLEAGQNMHIEATDLSNPQEGVSTQDLVFITKHILGKQVFDSPFKYLAADVDQNGLVNVTDILHIRRLILGITEEFPQAPSWQFYRMNYTWDANPLGGDKPVYQDIFDPQGDLYNVDFVGVKTGDVNMNAANGSQEVINRDSKVLELKMENVWTQPGLDGKLAIRVNHCSNLTGFQGTLTFDPSMIEITNLEIASKALSLGNFGLNRLADGKLSFSYDRQNEALLDNEVICYLEYKGLKSVNTAELFVLGNIPTPVESYFQSGSVSGLQLAFDEVSINHNKVEAQWALFQNSPNPWTGETVIDIDAPQRTIAWLSVFDMQGKEVFRQMRPLFEGQNHWNLQASDLNGAGVYFYRLETTEFSASKKMILTK